MESVKRLSLLVLLMLCFTAMTGAISTARCRLASLNCQGGKIGDSMGSDCLSEVASRGYAVIPR